MELLTVGFFACVLVGLVTWLLTAARARAKLELAAEHPHALQLRRSADEMRRLLELAQARDSMRSADERDALIVRRWLRNAMEDPNMAPHKAVGSGAAVALALCGGAQFLKLLAGFKTEEQWLAEGHALTDPEVQAAKHWDMMRAEYNGLCSPALELGAARELLFGEKEGGSYWNQHLLTQAAGDVLAKSNAGAMEIARQRLTPSADLAAKH